MMSLGKFLDPKNDIAFKQVFGTEKNKDILIHFLNDMIPFPGGSKIETVRFLKPSLDPDAAIRKQSIVDVLCVDEKGCQYIVEMQVANTQGFEKRAQYYAAKAYVNQMEAGGAYHNLKEIIFLAKGIAAGRAEGFTEGEAVGESIGAQNAIKRMAADLLAQGVEMTTIQAVTQLSPEEIESLTTYSEK